MSFNPETLASVYRQLYYAIDGKTSEEAIYEIWKLYGTDALSLPEHLFDRRAVRAIIEQQVHDGNTPNELEAARMWGYSRRWVKDVIRDAKNSKER